MADRRLRVFHAVAQLLSFTKAAESLYMTQPAVTFQVRQLEEQFNTRLFDRTHNRIALTEAGRSVYSYSSRIFELYDEMDNSVREITGDVSGVLIIGASMTIAEYMLPALLGEFKRAYPEVGLRLKVGNTDAIVMMVESNIIDLGVVEAPVSNKSLSVELCREDQLVAIVAPDHPLSVYDEISAEKILKYPYISREEGSGTRDVFVEYLQQHGFDEKQLNVIMELGSPEAIKGAVEAGIGVTVMSRTTLDKELALGTLKAIAFNPPLVRPFSFVHQRQKFRQRAMDELLSFARNYCKTHCKE
ncbi:MAG: LysR family transcriptional regulator [Gammaproteobacteria bacterium]|nr:LysR family transcriptional regulator [Gammaproteobacteria bacterium]MCF6230142.1 LysR family transcriptional regulator [Gammaproteobacteria bacterium]